VRIIRENAMRTADADDPERGTEIPEFLEFGMENCHFEKWVRGKGNYQSSEHSLII